MPTNNTTPRSASRPKTLLEAAAELEVQHLELLERIDLRLGQLDRPVVTYTPRQFATVCHTSERTIRRAIDDDRIRIVVLGDRSIVIPSTELTGDFASHHRRRQIRAVRNSA